MFLRISLMLAVGALLATAADFPKAYGGGKVDEVVWVRLDSGDLLLESVMGIAKEHNITDGAVLTAAGSLETCKFHGVGGTMTHVTEPVEILNLGGIIADGSPHFHVVVSNKARGAFGGHLEDGCKVMGHVELTIAKFSGAPMTRKDSPVGANALQKK